MDSSIVGTELEKFAFIASHQCGVERIHKCVCGQVDGAVLADIDRFRLPLRTICCRTCGTTRSDMAIEDRPLFYRTYYPRMHPGLGDEDARQEREQRQAHVIMKRIRALPSGAPPIAGATVYEIGGMAGNHLPGVQYRSYDMSGRCADGPLDDARALYVLNLHVLEHTPDPVSALAEWSTLLAPGGLMVTIVPDLLQCHTHRYVKKHGLRAWWHIAHTWNWTASNIDIPHRLAGLEVMSTSYLRPGVVSTVGSLLVFSRATAAHERVVHCANK